MTAQLVVVRLLEQGPDDVDLKSELLRVPSAMDDFLQGVDDILRDARMVYMRLADQGVISLLKKYRRRDGVGVGFDNESIAQAVLRIALEERGSLGAKNAYNLIRRWS